MNAHASYVGVYQKLAAILGLSAYQRQSKSPLALSSGQVESARKQRGGQIQPTAYPRTRWYLADLETAEVLAAGGDLSWAAALMKAARGDGVFSGILSTRTAGLVRLPKRFSGSSEIVAELEPSSASRRAVFEEMCPSAELALLAADGELLGVGVGELLPVPGRAHPVLVRHSPEWLWFHTTENRWYFRSVAGLIPITPGDGQWVLHTPGGRIAPWENGLWRAVGRAFIRKSHANLSKDNWEATLANPARVATAPQAAAEEQKQSYWRKVLAWGRNTVFGLTPGYDVKLLESNGRGYESFRLTIEDQNNEYMIAVAGQTVTTDGGTGFANADIHKSIRADLIKATADALALTVNTQILPAWTWDVFGEDMVGEVGVEWDVTPPKDAASEANALMSAGTAVKALDEALASHGLEVDAEQFAERFGVPVKKAAKRPSLELVQGGVAA